MNNHANINGTMNYFVIKKKISGTYFSVPDKNERPCIVAFAKSTSARIFRDKIGCKQELVIEKLRHAHVKEALVNVVICTSCLHFKLYSDDLVLEDKKKYLEMIYGK